MGIFSYIQYRIPVILLFLLAGITGNAAAANPTVSGNTISWPNDGHYIVEVKLTGERLCEGLTSCTVPDGEYRVTRQSNGASSIRDIVVGNPPALIIDQSNFEYSLQVSGLTINWIGEGWFQVQDAQTYEAICNGTESCTVPSVGQYLVTNHSLGFRYEIEVSDNPGPRVAGNTISWPRDGWYQIKNADSGELVCEGVDACSLADGNYLVSRFFIGGGTTWPISLTGQTDNPEPNRISVTGNTISWPNNAEYEVQLVLTGETICKGGNSCTVPDGIYWVISKSADGSTGGSRQVVGEAKEIEITQSNFEYALRIDELTINWSLDGWYQILDANTFEEVCTGVYACVVPEFGRYIVINHTLDYRTEVEVSEQVGPAVSNNTIYWPDDGWYRVKNATTGDVLCENVDACTVPAGTYLVSRFYINGGMTWRIAVGVQSGASPTVDGNTISWPDDGWYQVENRVTGEIVCQGGRSCTVPDGIYWVIRFYEGGNSGVRVEVGNPQELEVDEASFADSLSVSGLTINWTIGGWYQVQDGNSFAEICNGADSCTVPSSGQYIVIKIMHLVVRALYFVGPKKRLPGTHYCSSPS